MKQLMVNDKNLEINEKIQWVKWVNKNNNSHKMKMKIKS